METTRGLLISEKIKIIRRIDDANRRIRLQDVAKEFNTSYGTVCSIYRHKELWLSRANANAANLELRRFMPHRDETFERALELYIRHGRHYNKRVTGKMVVAEGHKYAEILGLKKFKGSNKWLNTFLKKYKISFRISKSLVPSVAEQYLSVVNLIAQYSSRDVFAASETGLFFKCLPSDCRALKQKLCQSGSLPEQRLTIVCAANKDGSEKLPLLVIGNDNNFSHMGSIIYRTNPKSWITWCLFRDWIMELDRRFAEQQRKVLLFVKECTVYPKALQAVLKAINLQFLPMKDPPLQQALEIGVIQILKKYYRIELLKHTSQHTGTEMRCTNVAVPYGIEILECAWYTRVRRSTIQKCFKNANYPMNDVDAFESNISDCIVDANEKQYESAEWFFDYNKVDQQLITYGRMSDADILDCAQAHKMDNNVTCPVEEEAEDVSIEGSDHDEAMNERSEHTADDDSTAESETRYQKFQGPYQESDFGKRQLASTRKNGASQPTVDSEINLITQYNARDVFCASETYLLFKSLKTNTQELEESGCSDRSLLEQCLTIMCAANMNGTEKLPLLVIGKDNLSACPGGPNALYRIDSEARSNTELLREWIMLLDRKFVTEQRNVLLFVEEHDAHLKSMQHELEAISLHIFHSNSSLLPPLRLGVIQDFKQYYRQELFKHHSTEFAEKVDSLDITIVEGLNIVAQSWEVAVTPEVIKSCFVQAGFPVSDLVRVCSVTTPCSTEATQTEILDESAVYQWSGESAEAKNVLCNAPLNDHMTLENNAKLHNKTKKQDLKYAGSYSIPEQPGLGTVSSQLRKIIKARNKSPELSDAKRLKIDALLQESFRKNENVMEDCYDPLEDVLDSNNASPECYPESSVQPCKMETLERTVELFIKYGKDCHMTLSPLVISSKALSFAALLGIKDFKASQAWIRNIFKKNDLQIKEPSSKECLDDDYPHSQLIEKLIQEYYPQDVFSASGTGLFFKCLPDKVEEFKEKKCSDGALAEQRLTIMCLTNMDGSQKLPLLVIGNEKTPCCFRSEKTFPVIYRSNSNAWITWNLFRNWILELDKTFQEQQRNVLLFVSDCTGHAKSLQTELAAINLQFLSKEDSPLRQPLQLGVIRILKKYYRRSLWNLWTDNSEEISVHPDITALDSINILAEAWSTRIKPETIKACFKNAGFSFSDDEEDPLAIYDENTRDSEIEFESSTLFTEYCAVDKLVTYSGHMEDADFVDSSQEILQTYNLSNLRKTVIKTEDHKIVPFKDCSAAESNPVVNSTRSKGNSHRKRIRKCFNNKLDLALVLYIRSNRDNRVWITRKQVRRKALEYAEYFGINNFKASNGWSKCFFKRCNINFDKLPDENDSQEDYSIESISRLVWQYNISDVFSGVETALFYKCLRNESKHFHGRRCKEGNLPEQRLTIMCIANMNGSEKLPLLVVGNDKNINCFNDVDVPVIYRCNSKSWMTWVLFRDWMLILDRKFAAEQRNVLLFVEESSIHPKSLQAELKAINLHFLPANNSALRLPIKFDVIQLLKKHYRQKLTKHVEQRNGRETLSSEPTVTDSICVLRHVWNNLTSRTIQNSFKVAGFPINDEDPLAGSSDVNETDTSGSESDSSSIEFSKEVNEVDYNLRTHGPISESDILEGVQQQAH